MAYARGHRIFRRDAAFAAFSGKSLISFKDVRIKNHRSLLAQNSMISNIPCSLPKKLQMH